MWEFCFLCFVIIVKKYSVDSYSFYPVIINEINSAAGRIPDKEFVELKIVDPCLQKRYSNLTHGPSLNGFYVINLVGSSASNGLPIIEFVANLSNSFFKHNSSLFVIGQSNTSPDLAFTSDHVIHQYKIFHRQNLAIQVNRLSYFIF